MSDQEQEPELPGEPEEQEDVEANEEANDGKLVLVFTCLMYHIMCTIVLYQRFLLIQLFLPLHIYLYLNRGGSRT